MTYEGLYDHELLGLSNQNTLERHSKAAEKLAKVSSGASCGWDPIHFVLTVCIMMYSQDSLELDDPKEAERMQLMYACLLQRWKK